MMRRSRPRPNAPLVRPNTRLPISGIAILLLLLTPIIANLVEGKPQAVGFEGVVASGRPILKTDFARERQYIRYVVAGGGRYYWYGAIADRFHLSGRWNSIVQASLEKDGKTHSPEEIEEAQFQLEPGTELRIPLLWN